VPTIEELYTRAMSTQIEAEAAAEKERIVRTLGAPTGSSDELAPCAKIERVCLRLMRD
jgi:hypothetical protein